MRREKRVQTFSGKEIHIGERRLTPRSRAVIIPWENGAWVWNRPLGIRVEDRDRVEEIPIRDWTRIARIFLYSMSGLFIAAGVILSLKKKENDHE